MKKHLLNEINQEVKECDEKINWYKQYLNNNPLSNAALEAVSKYNAISSQLTLWLHRFEQLENTQ